MTRKTGSTETKALGQAVTCRRVLTALGALVVGVGVAACTSSAASSGPAAATASPASGQRTSGTGGNAAFVNPLKIPPLLTPRTDAQGRKVFDLTMQTGTSRFLPGGLNEGHAPPRDLERSILLMDVRGGGLG